MKFFGFIKNAFNSLTSKLKASGKALGAVGAVGGATLMSTPAKAAVTYDDVTGTLTGAIDTTLYTSGIPIAIGFLTFTLAVIAVFALLKRSH